MNAVSFVHQSKGGDRWSFRPSGSGLGLPPLAPSYQALYSWQEFFQHPGVFVQYLHHKRSFLPRLSSILCHVLLLYWWVLKRDAEFSGASIRSMSPAVNDGTSVRAPSHLLCAEAPGSSCSPVLRHAVVDRRCSTPMKNSTKVGQSGSNCAPLMGAGKAFILGRGAFVCLGFFMVPPCLCSFLHFPQGQLVFLSQNAPNQIIVPTSSSRHMHPTSHCTPEIYGSREVEFMFIFYQIAKRNS